MLAADYARTYRANAILTASPAQLVLLLYDGVLKSLMLAREAFDRPADDVRRLELINTHLLKAQSIIAELQAGLNLDAGGEFARTMQRLYDYHHRRLFEANLRKQVEPIVEVERLFTELRDAWAEMLGRQDGVPAETARAQA
ncbi:MAG TPA: flagellar export chaperone FliS [Opitutus sp.]|nr:flagellar export chaperone FliS [Opitutus sp.]